MSLGLAQLPFDNVHQIAGFLDARSHSNLAKTCRSLYRHLQDENTAKKTVQATVPYCLWAQLALSTPATPATPKRSFRETLGRCNSYRSAIQKNRPFSACIIAYANSFAYSSGILCYATRVNLRILNFNDRQTTEKVFGGNVFSHQVATTPQGRGQLDLEFLRSIQVLEYAEDIVVLQCDFGVYGQYIFAVNIADSRAGRSGSDGRHPRVLLCAPVRSTNKLFVRHTKKYLILGSHSATGSHNHHEWLLEGYSLETSTPITAEPLQLRDFYGSEIGSTVCFTIYKDEFYALTNQTSFESEEVDWTSYYHFVRFRLDDTWPELRIQVIWRRQHLEGPIHDAWTDLGFQIDHCTGELLIVECRKEWVNGGSRSIRTYYTQPFHRVPHKELKDGLRHPPNDPLMRTLEEHNNSRWEESMVRAPRYVHAEFADGQAGEREYIRAKTKWNGYHFNAQSFVDLVTEEVTVDGDWRPRQRIKVRVVSRKELSPLVRGPDAMEPRPLMLRPRVKDRDGEDMEDGERAFGPSRVSVWPPDDAPQGLHDLLCPDGRAGDVQAVLGDEGIIYMAGPAREPGSSERALVFVSFDPTFGFVGMKRLDGTIARPKVKDGLSVLERKRKSVSIQDPGLRLDTSESVKRDRDTGLAEHTKRLKIEAGGAQNSTSSASTGSCSGSMIQQPQRQEDTKVALTLDPSAVAQTPEAWPPPKEPTPALTPGPSAAKPSVPSPSLSASPSPGPEAEVRAASAIVDVDKGKGKGKAKDDDHDQDHDVDQGKGKGKAKATPLLLTRREKAGYLSIGKGYWLR